MDTLITKVGDYLVAQGPIGILCIVLAVLLWRSTKQTDAERKRNDLQAAELKELAKDSIGINAVLKDRLK